MAEKLGNQELLNGRRAPPRRSGRAARPREIAPPNEAVQAFERSDFAYLPLAPIPANLIEIAERIAGRPLGAEIVAAVERARLFTGWSGGDLTVAQAQARHLHVDGAPAVEAPSRMLGADRAIPERRLPAGRLPAVDQVNPLDLGQDDD